MHWSWGERRLPRTFASYFHFACFISVMSLLPECLAIWDAWCTKKDGKVINMSQAWDKEKIAVPNRNWTYDLPFNDFAYLKNNTICSKMEFEQANKKHWRKQVTNSAIGIQLPKQLSLPIKTPRLVSKHTIATNKKNMLGPHDGNFTSLIIIIYYSKYSMIMKDCISWSGFEPSHYNVSDHQTRAFTSSLFIQLVNWRVTPGDM